MDLTPAEEERPSQEQQTVLERRFTAWLSKRSLYLLGGSAAVILAGAALSSPVPEPPFMRPPRRICTAGPVRPNREQPVVESDPRAQAFRHLKDAVTNIRKGQFDLGEEHAHKAYKADPACSEAQAVVLVSGYARQYTKLADEARKSLNGNNIVDLGRNKGECAFIKQGDDWFMFRVKGENKRFTIEELNKLPGVRFRITREFLDNAANPASDLILGAYQYLQRLDREGLRLPEGVNAIPDRWVVAARSPDAITREQAGLLMELPRLKLHE